MSSDQQMPPWLQEQLAKMQQSQQNLQSIMTQKQYLEIEHMETEKALDEIKKAGENDDVYKHAGSILIKSTKKDLIEDLEEKKELAKTRSAVLSKQEEQVKQSLKEQESKITEMMKGQTAGTTNSQPPSTLPPK
jgi:prefoldin beta subunit